MSLKMQVLISAVVSHLNFSSPKKVRQINAVQSNPIQLRFPCNSSFNSYAISLYVKRKPDFLTNPYWPYFLQNAIVISRCVTFSSPFFLLLPNLFDTEKSVSPSQNVSSTYYSSCYVLFSSFFSFSRSDVCRLQTKVTQT